MKATRLTAEEKATFKEMLNSECDYTMSDEVMDEFLSLGRVVKVGKWHSIIAEGDVNPDVYIAMEGILRLWYRDGHREKTAFFSRCPAMLMNYHSYYADQPSFYNFQTCTSAKLFLIKRRQFDALIDRRPEFAKWNLRMLQIQQYYFEVKHRLNTGLAKERYLSLLKTLPDIMQEVPLNVVASYLGITPQHLSRLRKTLF